MTDVEIDQESQLVMPKCYCIASYIPIFELHYEIIANLQVLKRLQRMEEFMSTGSLTVIEKLSDEQIGLLESYSNCDSIYPGLALNISCEKMDDIRYTVPENLSNLDIPWLCSPLFSVLSLNDLLFVIFALTQEKSLIFVSENLGLLTSSVLGSLALLRPLK